MRETQVKRTPGPAVGDRQIARAHSATEVDKAIFDVVLSPVVRCVSPVPDRLVSESVSAGSFSRG